MACCDCGGRVSSPILGYDNKTRCYDCHSKHRSKVALKKEPKMDWYSGYKISKMWQFGRAKVFFHWGSSKEYMGRFGGRWNWSIGIKFGRRDLRFDLLFCDLTFSWYED